MTARPPLLMAVFNSIENDGRALRAADALSETYSITVVSADGNPAYRNPAFHCVIIRIPPLPPPLRLIYFWLRVALQVMRTRPVRVYLHDYYLAGLGALLARSFRARVIYDAHELLIPDDNERQSRRSKVFYWLERKSVPRFDLIIAANQERAKVMQEQYALRDVPLVVRNIPPPEAPSGTPPDTLVMDYQKIIGSRADYKWLVYQGWMSKDRQLHLFIHALKVLDDEFHLLLIGGGPGLPDFRRLTAQLELVDRVVFLGPVPRQHLPHLMGFCRIGLVSYPRSGLNNRYCAPNKIFEYAQAGLPVLTSCQPVLRRMLERYQIGKAFGCQETDDERHTIAEIASSIGVIMENYFIFDPALKAFVRQNRWASEALRLVSAVEALSN